VTALTVLAEPADAGLAGLPGAAGGPTVALGAARADEPAAVRWLDDAPPTQTEPATERPIAPAADGPRPMSPRPAAERLIAPAGAGLWRVAPWPAADALFEIGSATGRRILVAGGAHGLAAAVAERAGARGLDVERVERLDAAQLAAAACVVLGEGAEGALPARAFAVLAAGRLLVVPRLERSFGLEDGLDHLEFADPDEAVALLEAHARNAAAFARVIAWGRRKAEPQRASLVYGRLADDLRGDRLAGPA
jgi:hypothetical protein